MLDSTKVIRTEYTSMKIPRIKMLEHCWRLEAKRTQRGIPRIETKAISVVLDDYSNETTGHAGGDENVILGSDENVMPGSDRASYAKSGIYHYSNEGVCSWYDFTKMIAEYSGNDTCEVLPCHSDEFPSKVKRPAYSVLDKTKIKETFGISVPYWTDSLKKCINNLK